MTMRHILFIIFSWLFCWLASAADFSVYDLRCEGLYDPIAIDSPYPHFSWKIGGNAREQVAYEIQVASSFRKLRKGDCDLWSSGKISSANQVMVPYQGKRLTSRSHAYWRVRVWNTDSDVKTGEMECALINLINESRPAIEKDAEIELRCRYRCAQTGQQYDICSDYSKIISFGTDGISGGGGAGEGSADGKNDVCPICHFCPQPLGLCIFIWLLIIIAVVAVIIVIAVVIKKKKRNG